MSQAGAYISSVGPGGPVTTLTGNSGGAVPPTGGNINVVGDTTTITVAGNPGTSTLTISASGSLSNSFVTGSGTATPAAGVLNVPNGSNINTTGAANTLTVNLVNSPSVSGSVTAGTGFSATTGNVAVVAGNVTLPNTNASGTQGEITFGGNRFISNFGTHNVFVGETAGNTTMTGISNVGVGFKALFANTTGLGSVALGDSALIANTTGASNVAVGLSALSQNTSGAGNIAIGQSALSSNTTGGTNIAIGPNAGLALNADSNIAIGSDAMSQATTASASIVIGNGAANAGDITSNNTIAIGAGVLVNGTSGNDNLAIGTGAMSGSPSGIRNIGIGLGALNALDSGSHNIGIGSLAGVSYSAGSSSNIVIGEATGSASESNTIRIGVNGSGTGQQNRCFIAGVASVAVSNTNMVTIDTTTGQFGSQAVPSSSITITGDSGGGLTGNSFTFTGGTTGLTFAGAGTTETLGGTLAIANGGTNATSFATTDGTVYYDGTRLVTTATGTANQVLTSNGAGVAPTYQSLPASTMPWTVVTGATQAIAVNNGYIANNAGTCVMTLPATAAVGDIIRVSGMNNATGWQIAQRAGQTIHFGTVDTTTGTGGSLSSSATYDSVELVCNIANTDFIVLSSIGNLAFV